MFVFAFVGALAATISIYNWLKGAPDGQYAEQSVVPSCKTQIEETTLRLCKGNTWRAESSQLELVAVTREGLTLRAVLSINDGVSDGRPRGYTRNEDVSVNTRFGEKLIRVLEISERPEFVDLHIAPLLR